jgi:hypothetical protein
MMSPRSENNGLNLSITEFSGNGCRAGGNAMIQQLERVNDVHPTITYAGVTVAKEKWLAGMSDILPAAVCRDGWFYRSCFKITAEECHLLVTEATKSCSLQYSSQIPKKLEQPKDGNEWGTKIGTCVGTIIESTQADKRISNEKCDDLTRWKSGK